MNPLLSSKLTLAKRPLATRVICVLLLVAAVWLAISGYSADLQSSYVVPVIAAFALSLLAYGLASSETADSRVSPAMAAAVVTSSLLIMTSREGEYTSHYSVILSLALASCYRSRAVMGIAAITAIVEQFVFGVCYQTSMFPVSAVRPHEWMLSHYLWVLISSVVLMFTCDGGTRTILVPQEPKPNAPTAEQSTTYMVLPKVAGKPLASGEQPAVVPVAMEEVPASMEELVRVAGEVGARAHKLHRSISNIEGPLKRMVQSINGANRGMQEIKDELSRTAASVIQITQSSEMHANKANDVFTAADEAAYGSQIGALSTEQSIRNMQRIRDQMDSIAARMDNLLNKSQLMVQVVGFADELALQSKVLSVNAAIEAAKAGDRGQGFSAVAREVKSLANQSKDATRQVRQILKEIQKSIAEVRRSIALGNETVDLASDQCRSTADSIKGLDGSVTSSRDAAEAIMNSSKDQVAGIMLISHAMNDIQTVSEQNSNSLNNLQTEAQKLNTITRDLVGEMSGYQALIEKLLAQCASLSQSESGN